MRTKRRIQGVLSYMLALILFVTSIGLDVSAAPGGIGGSDDASNVGSASWGRTGYQISVGLGKCTNEMYDSTQGVTLDEWLNGPNGYLARYYTPILSNTCYSIPLDKEHYNPTDNPDTHYEKSPNGLRSYYISSAGLSESKDVDNEAVKCLWNILYASVTDQGLTGSYALEVSNSYGGHTYYTIKSEWLPILMRAFKDEPLYQEWLSQASKTVFNPVVLVVEVSAQVKDSNGGKYFFRAGDVFDYYGLSSSMLYTHEFNGVSYPNCSSNEGTQSDTAGWLLENFRWNGDNRIICYLFGVYKSGGHYVNDRSGMGHVHVLAKQAQNDSITACYALNINAGPIVTTTPPPSGDPGDPPSGPPVNLSGDYTWHIVADDLAPSILKHGAIAQEDQTVETTAISGKNVQIAYVDVTQQDIQSWMHYLNTSGNATVTCEMQIKKVEINDFTLDRSAILSTGQTVGSMTYTGDLDTFIKTYLTGKAYLPMNPTVYPDVVGSSTSTASAVAYATEMKVQVAGSDIPFSNNQVHYAIWAMKGTGKRAYNFVQEVKAGSTQIKADSLGEASFDALSGIPTTENVFIDQGGQQWIVNVQFRMCVDKYKRNYSVEVPAYANYLYFSTGLNQGDTWNRTKSYSGHVNHSSEAHSGTNPTDAIKTENFINSTYHDKEATIDRDLDSDSRSLNKWVAESVNKLYQGITNNHLYSADYKYDYIVDACTPLKYTTTGVVSFDTLKAYDDDKLNVTVKNLEDQLKTLATGLNRNIMNTTLPTHPTDDIGHQEYTLDLAKTSAKGNDLDSPTSTNVKVIITVDGSNTSSGRDAGTTTYNHTNKNHSGAGPWSKDATDCPCGSNVCDGTHLCSEGSCSKGGGHNAVACSIGGSTHYTNAGTHANAGTCSTCGGTGKVSGTIVPPATTAPDVDCTTCGGDGKVGVSCSAKACTKCGKAQKDPAEVNCSNPDDKKAHWNSPNGPQPDCKKDVGEEWASEYDGYEYSMSAHIEVVFGDFVYESQGFWNPQNGKMLEYSGDFSQIYDSVKYLEISDVHCWRLTGGMQKGLSALFPQAEKLNNTNEYSHSDASAFDASEIINMFCNLKGFYFYSLASQYPTDYPLDDLAVNREFVNYTQLDGTVYETWRSDDESVSKPLYQVGRIANSFTPGNIISSLNRDVNASGEDNISITQKNGQAGGTIQSYASATPKMTGDYINDDEHAMKALSAGDDDVKFTYSIGEQGGRSHKSFPGFMKQALARSFYFPDGNGNSDPKNAYSNYIVVQSDFFAVTMAQNEDYGGTNNEDTPLSFVGNQYSTDWFVDRITGTETGADATLLSTDQSMMNELLQYANWESPWVIDKKNTDLQSNGGGNSPKITRTSNLLEKPTVAQKETYADGISTGRGKMSVVSVTDIKPIEEYVKAGRQYTEGNGYIIGLDLSDVSFKERMQAAGIASLSQYNADGCELFREWVPDTLCGDPDAAGTGLLTDFSGTFLTAGIKEDEGLPWIGYAGDGATNRTDTHALKVTTMNGAQVNYTPYNSYMDFAGGGSGTTSSGVHQAFGFTQDFGRKMSSYRADIQPIVNSNVWLAELSNDPDALGYMTSSCVDSTEIEFKFDPTTMTGNPTLVSIQHGTNYGSRKTASGYDSEVNQTGVDKLFPHSGNHNIDRYLPNKETTTGWGALGYDCVLQYTKLLEGVVPIPNIQTGSWTDKFSSDDSMDKHVRNNGIVIPASSNTGFDTTSAKDDNAVTNPLIILDPVAAVNVALIGDSDLLPDATNKYIEEIDANGVVTGKYGYNIRDQRVQPTTADFEGGSEVSGSIDNEVTIVSDQNISKTPIPTTERYEMKDTSTLVTESAKHEHYIYTGNVASNVIDVSPMVDGTLGTTVISANDFRSEGEYFLSYFTDSNAEHQATVKTELEYNDYIKVVGTSLYLERNLGNIRLNYSTIRDSILEYYQTHVPSSVTKPDGAGVNWYYEKLFGTDSVDDVIHFKKDATIELDLSSIKMPKGSSIVVSLPFAQEVHTSDFDIQVASSAASDTTKYGTYTYVSTDGKTLNIVIEAHDNLQLGKTKLVYVNNSVGVTQGIVSFADSCVKFDDIWLCDLGNLSDYDGEFVAIGAIQHEYEHGLYHKSVSTRHASYNQYACTLQLDYAAWKVAANITVFSNHLYAYSATKGVTWEFSEEFYENPHIIETSFWKAYVAGFGVGESNDRSAAHIIIDPWSDAMLDNEENWIFWPDGSNAKPLKIKDFKSQACLIKFRDKLYVTLTEDALQHKITQISTQVTEFDELYFGLSATDNVSFKIKDKPDLYPISDSYFTDDVSSNYTKEELRNRTYEYCFALSGLSGRPLYRVGSAFNVKFRFTYQVDIKLHGEESMTDWDKVVEKLDVSLSGSDDELQSNVISLDDEFVIYWDNVDNRTSMNNNYDTKGTSSSLLGGWVHKGTDFSLPSDSSDRNIGVPGYTDGMPFAEDIWKWQNLTSVGKGGKMDTTKWIAAKYITFDFDVYVPASESGVPDPTMGFFYEEDGSRKLRPVVYVKAGDPIYLGSSGEQDGRGGAGVNSNNGGTFVDFGTPQFDSNGNLSNEPYTYHFWCALSSGEHVSRHAYCHTVAINDLYVGDSTNGNNNPGYKENRTSSPGIVTNITDGTTTRVDAVNNDLTFGVIGRIGALTIVDSGDPTYSDTFKYSDSASNKVESYLIYKLVKKIDSYSNVKGEMGSQHSIVLDPFDVRGRIAANDMKSLFVNSVPDGSNGEEAYRHEQVTNPTDLMKTLYETEYNTYEFGLDDTSTRSGYNTYGTQWYKAGNGTYSSGSAGIYRYMLPLNPYEVFAEIASDLDQIPSGQSASDFAKVGDGGRHKPLQMTQTKLGYELFCTLESIGNYYGTSEPTNEEVENVTVNDNGDFGQMKVQIRPIYYYISKETDSNGNPREVYPVDVYMQKSGNYVMINSGGDSFDSLTPLKNSYFPYYLETNTTTTGDAERGYDLDQNMLRRGVTKEESIKTWYMTKPNEDGLIYTRGSMLTPFQQSVEDGDLGQTEMSSNYCYGNSQYLFLRKRNLTYVGGETEALGYVDLPNDTEVYTETVRHAQKWYFGLSLPSSSRFVRTGYQFSSENIITDGYILCVIEVYAIGDTWTLKYKSDVSKLKLQIDEIIIPWERYHKSGGFDREWLIPVNYYDIEKTSTLDLNTEGSH